MSSDQSLPNVTETQWVPALQFPVACTDMQCNSQHVN